MRKTDGIHCSWKPPHMPSHCSDSEPFTMEHALSCSRGGYVSLRHNEVRDLPTDLLSDTCNNVTAEPHLQPVCGERFQSASAITADEARLDIQAGGFGVVDTRLRTSTSECSIPTQARIAPYPIVLGINFVSIESVFYFIVLFLFNFYINLSIVK